MKGTIPSCTLSCALIGAAVLAGTCPGWAAEGGESAAATLVVSPEDAVRIALGSYPGLLGERERLDEVQNLTREAWASVYPEVDALVSAARTQDPGFLNQPGFENFPGLDPNDPSLASLFEPVKTETYDTRIQVEQLLYSFGKVGKAVKAARVNEGQVGLEIRNAELSVARNAALACYALARDKIQSEVLEAERASLERQVQQARDFLDIGTGTRLQLLQAQAALSALRPREIAAEGAVESSRARLNEALGRPPLAPVDVIGRILEDAELPELPPVETLLARSAKRADLEALATNRTVLDLRGGIEKANLLPEVRFRGSYGIRSLQTESVFDTDFLAWDAGVFLEWNLYDGGATPARVRRLESQRRQNEYHSQTREGQIGRDLVAAVEEYERAKEASDAAAEAIEQAEEARRIAVEERKWGAATMLDVLNAERTLTTSRFEMLRAVHDALAALAEVYFQVGMFPGEELESW